MRALHRANELRCSGAAVSSCCTKPMRSLHQAILALQQAGVQANAGVAPSQCAICAVEGQPCKWQSSSVRLFVEPPEARSQSVTSVAHEPSIPHGWPEANLASVRLCQCQNRECLPHASEVTVHRVAPLHCIGRSPVNLPGSRFLCCRNLLHWLLAQGCLRTSPAKLRAALRLPSSQTGQP